MMGAFLMNIFHTIEQDDRGLLYLKKKVWN